MHLFINILGGELRETHLPQMLEKSAEVCASRYQTKTRWWLARNNEIEGKILYTKTLHIKIALSIKIDTKAQNRIL